MIDIQEITQKIMEEENNLIAKAFTFHIGSLLMNNGIIPVMTKYTFDDLDAITDTDKYKIVKKFGISFDELDTREHDKQVKDKAIDDFVELCLKHKSKDDYPIMCFDEETIKKFAEQLKAGD